MATLMGALAVLGQPARADDCTPVPSVVTCDDGSGGTGSQPAPDEPGGEPEPDGGSGQQQTTPSLVAEPAAALLDLANRDRAAAGAPPLAARADVAEVSGAHSLAMAEAGDIWHNDAYFSAENRRHLDARKLAENVAMGPSAERIHERLMASPGHRANLLDPSLTVAGFTVATDGAGTLYVTQAFVQPAPPAAPATATGLAPPATPAPPTSTSTTASNPNGTPAATPAPETRALVLAANDGAAPVAPAALGATSPVGPAGTVATFALATATAGLTAVRRRGAPRR